MENISFNTPRRSSRLNKGSILAPDYEDIISRSANKASTNDDKILKPVWTPASVGRVSMRRRRKSMHARINLVEKAFDQSHELEVRKHSPIFEAVAEHAENSKEPHHESASDKEDKLTDSSVIIIDDSIVESCDLIETVALSPAVEEEPTNNPEITADKENLNLTFNTDEETHRRSRSSTTKAEESNSSSPNKISVPCQSKSVPLLCSEDSLQVGQQKDDLKDQLSRDESKNANMMMETPIRTMRSKKVTFNSSSKVVSGPASKRFKPTPHKPDFVTRRQRSISLSELSENPLVPVTITPTKICIPNQTSTQKKLIKRTKMPNFAAIHKKNEERSENVLEYVARKEDRFKFLTSSASKFRLAQSQEVKTVSQPTKVDHPSGLPRPIKRAAATVMQSSAAKRVAEQQPKPTEAAKPVKRAVQKDLFNKSKQQPEQRKEADLVNKINLPKPQPVLKPIVNVNHDKAITTKQATPKPKSYLPNPQLAQKRTGDVNFKTTSIIPPRELDKVTVRRERHKQMFKANETNTRRQKERDLSQLVRSNRRFELQMQYRRQQENN